MNFFGVSEEDDRYEDVPEFESSGTASRGKNNVVSLHTQKNVRLILYEPRTYDETQDIADNLKNHRPVVVNLQRIRRDQGIRVIDFLSGTVYALGGNIQKLGPHIFICTPANVDIQGTITELMQDEA